MITGFNTDVEHDGVVYHVQTEDKGLDSPLILSLVYSGGAILASKRSPYEDLIAAGFDEAALAQRLKRQHRLICAAINAGRIDELKRMGERAEVAEPETSPPSSLPDTPPAVEPVVEEEDTLAGKPAVDVDSPTPVRRLVVTAEPVTSIDVTSADAICELDDALRAMGIEMCFAEMKDPVKDKLKRFGVFERFGEQRFFATIEEAVNVYLAKV